MSIYFTRKPMHPDLEATRTMRLTQTIPNPNKDGRSSSALVRSATIEEGHLWEVREWEEETREGEFSPRWEARSHQDRYFCFYSHQKDLLAPFLEPAGETLESITSRTSSAGMLLAEFVRLGILEVAQVKEWASQVRHEWDQEEALAESIREQAARNEQAGTGGPLCWWEVRFWNVGQPEHLHVENKQASSPMQALKGCTLDRPWSCDSHSPGADGFPRTATFTLSGFIPEDPTQNPIKHGWPHQEAFVRQIFTSQPCTCEIGCWSPQCPTHGQEVTK